MLKLYRVKFDEYIIVRGKDAYYGGLAKTVGKLMQLGISDQEIEIGLLELETKEHHVAEYGVYGRFIYSMRVA